MTAELYRAEPGTQGVRRIARAHIGNALEAIQVKKPSAEHVHTARKELKKARAALRLLRGAVGDRQYKRENVALRDAARPLSQVRDSGVILDTLDLLVDRFGTPARAVPADALRKALRRERTEMHRTVLKSGALKSQREALRRIYERAARWQVGEHGWSVVGAGFARVYSKGRKALAAAEKDRTPANLHEWRKQVKYLWHQLQALQPLWPGAIGELADQAHLLADYLGEDHDLSVLRGKVLERKDAVPGPAARGTLLALIDRLRTELRDKAMVLGQRLYEEKPTVFAARFGQYWRDWQRRR
jgi:CHAD domain-containing protein